MSKFISAICGVVLFLLLFLFFLFPSKFQTRTVINDIHLKFKNIVYLKYRSNTIVEHYYEIIMIYLGCDFEEA